MLARSPTATLRRGLKTDALSRLQLDINAAHNNTQHAYREPVAPVEKSPAALRGESLRGNVQLPHELQEAVNKAILGKLLLLLELYTRAGKLTLEPPLANENMQLPTITLHFVRVRYPSTRIYERLQLFYHLPLRIVTARP